MNRFTKRILALLGELTWFAKIDFLLKTKEDIWLLFKTARKFQRGDDVLKPEKLRACIIIFWCMLCNAKRGR